MNDIGIVEYSKDTEKNCILADWYYIKDSKKIIGTGIAKGESTGGYEGEYIVTYYNRAGDELSKFNLKISKNENYYELTWISNGETVYYGAGMERNGKLYAGWRCS
ncbi:MAG: hypothetical protein PHN88_09765 [Ignavibacteria bacterium]|nr:hypothetical protein [Ignavibacteria bacterium]